MKPMLDPQRDLKGATPETLARALFRRVEPLRPSRPRGKAVVRDEESNNEGTHENSEGARRIPQ